MFELTEGHPFYMQHIAHILWERCEFEKTVEEDEIESALTLLLEREGNAFSTLWESLRVSQRRVLSGIANKGSEAHVFSSDFLDEQPLSSPSTVRTVVS